MTIIEKFEQSANLAGYAFGLLTPDDIGGASREALKPRARQNVSLDFSWARHRVCGVYGTVWKFLQIFME